MPADPWRTTRSEAYHIVHMPDAFGRINGGPLLTAFRCSRPYGHTVCPDLHHPAVRGLRAQAGACADVAAPLPDGLM